MENTAFKRIILVVMVCAFSISNAQKKGNSILGKWRGTDARTEKGGIEFLKDGTAKIMMMGQPLPISAYQIDASKDPMPIGLVVKRGGQEMTIYGLMKFIDTNTIKWEVFPMAQKQPTAFSDNAADTSVVLKRE